MVPAILDANIARVAEGLRVIEEYTRFVLHNERLTTEFVMLRKMLRASENNRLVHIRARDTTRDVRARETPERRKTIEDLLLANFKRVQEGLRVLEEYTGESLYTQYRYRVYELEREVLFFRTRPRMPKRGVYLISHDLKILRQGIDWGVALVQLRDTHSPRALVFKKARILQAFARDAGVLCIVNDDLEIARTVHADGFHSGQDGPSLEAQRAALGREAILGRSTHSLGQGLRAEEDGADYVSIGPLWETPSKPERRAIGFSYLSAAEHWLTIPYVAIGGVALERMDEVMQYNPPFVALIRDYENVPTMIEHYFS